MALAGVTLITGTAGAQWIGTPGGGVEVSPTPAAPAPAAPAPAAPAIRVAPSAPSVAPTPDLGSADPGLSSPSLGAPSLAMPGGMAPGGMAPGGAPGGGAPGPSSADMADCRTNVEQMRGDLEKRGGALQAASKKKLPPSELCPLFRNFVSSQQKFLGYLRANKTKCGVPDDVLTTLRKNSGSVAGVRDKVCKIAAEMKEGGGNAGPSGPPPQSSVASGLGLQNGLPGVSANQRGGVFDTLGGSALR